MRTMRVFAFLALTVPGWTQDHELSFSLGSTVNDLKTAQVSSTGGKALQVNYAYHLWGKGLLAISGEIHMLANPQRQVAGTPDVTKDFASLYLTPGIRLKFNPKGRIQPWAALGGGYALYEQSTTTLSGGVNPAPRHIGRGAFQFGGGVDVPVVKWFGLRGEVRDFYTGLPSLNVATLRGGGHNAILSAGIVLGFGRGK